MSTLTLKDIHSLPLESETAADSNCPGLIVRVSRDGRRTWAYRYRADGVLRRMTLGVVAKTPSAKPHEMPLKAAREAYYAARAERQKVGDPLAERRNQRRQRRDTVRETSLTIQKTGEAFLAAQSSRLAPSTVKEYRRQFDKHFLPALGSARSIASITHDELHAKIIAPQKRLGHHVTANRLTATLKGWLSWCQTEYGIESAAVPLKIDAKIEKPRDRVLTDHEIRSLWATTENGDSLMQCLRFILVTGLRPGEAAGLSRHWIDEDRLTIPATKNGRAHSIPLSCVAKTILTSVPERADGSVFGVRVDQLSHRIDGMTGKRQAQAAARRAKLSPPPDKRRVGRARQTPALGSCAEFHPHDLRRTATTTLARLGCPLEIIERVLNHSPSGITQKVYMRHSYEAEIRNWLEQLGAFIQGLGTGKVASIAAALAQREKAA
jgi:integrase